MATALKLNTEMATQTIDALANLFDGGANTLKIYDDSDGIPADADDGVGAAVLLVTISLPTPAFGAAAAGVVAKTGAWTGTVIAAGTAHFYRLLDAAGSGEVQGTVGLVAGTFNLEFADITWIVDATVTVDSFTLTLPES